MADAMNSGTVGKGKPPKESRFQPGQSGNPTGRRKGRENAKTIVHRVAHEFREVVEGGVRQRLTTVGLILKRLQQRAVNGDLASKVFLDDIRQRYQPEDTAPKLRGICIPPPPTQEEFEKELEALRARHAWVEANREQIWEDMGLNRGTPKPAAGLVDAP